VSKNRLLVIVGCHGDDKNPACPHLVSEATPGAGCATDYYCTSEGKRRMADGYIEWPSEMRKAGEFPSFCPLKRDTRKGKR
jgi:hypothetical protein